VLLAQYCSGDQIEKNVMGRICSEYGEGERRIQGSGRERDHTGDPGINGRIIIRWNFRK
jgi:hypothetical protein